MDRGVWKQPVILEIYGRPGTVIVPDTLEAAMMLMRAWPAKRTDAHMIAVAACRDVLSGRAICGMARANFIDAALDAGYHIQPETFLTDPWDWTERSAPVLRNAPADLEVDPRRVSGRR